MKKEILNNIKSIIKKKTRLNRLENNFNIIQSKLLDSIDILDIISMIEKKHKIKFIMHYGKRVLWQIYTIYLFTGIHITKI